MDQIISRSVETLYLSCFVSGTFSGETVGARQREGESDMEIE